MATGQPRRDLFYRRQKNGGGTKDELLCRFCANGTGRTVVAGPVEATVMGNAAIQLLKCGAIGSEKDIPSIIRKSEKLYDFTPEKNYDNEYESFKNIIRKR